MALDPVTMATTIADNLQALAGTPVTDRAKVIEYFTAICRGIIDHVKADMVVDSTGADPQGGVVNSVSTVIS